MFCTEILNEIAKNSTVKKDEPMSQHTTFRIGGPADIFIEASDTKELINIIRYLQKEKCRYFVIGNGSNLLVDDKGYRGVIVSTKGNDNVRIYKEGDKNFVNAGAGILLSKLASITAQNGFAGFEFAGGIPGTLGGAVAMNAGAYGGEIKDVIESARVITSSGDIITLNKDKLEMSYRSSIVQKEQMIVLDALFAFENGDRQQIEAKMKELNEQRRSKQPLEYGSAGSTFKRPEGHFAGKLIQDAGLKGYRCGDIMVSEKHSGFVVNVGNGTFEQAMSVIDHVRDEVMKSFGVNLELEVKILSNK